MGKRVYPSAHRARMVVLRRQWEYRRRQDKRLPLEVGIWTVEVGMRELARALAGLPSTRVPGQRSDPNVGG